MIALFILIGIASLGLIFLMHYFLFLSLAHFLNITSHFYLNALRIIFIFLPISFILASILIHRFSNIFVRLYYTIAASWFGILLYFVLACLLAYFIIYLGKVFCFEVNQKFLIIGLSLAAAAVIIYGIIAAQNIKIKELNIALPNSPAEWQGKTAVFISDLHLGAIDNYRFASSVANKIDELNPDILLIGGDFYDGQTNVDLDKLAQFFSTIKAPLGKFFVTGNHEEFGNSAKYTDAVKKAGINVLDNKLTEINGLQIIGVDYKSAFNKNDYEAILASLKIDKNKPSILLRHVPDKIEVAPKFGISLELCGHAHKGQLFPIQIIEYFLYDGFQYGLKKSGSTIIYTSSGAGVWGPPMRVLADPEIVKIIFK
ncbi:MAG: metallophosphoesterase [Patescibacteria group bacterium]|nr:metallophosphoesterase [Patescibacteria group bacterium]